MNHFEITLKTNRSEIEILTTRALLAVAAVASFVYADEENYYASIGLGIVLVGFSFYLKCFIIQMHFCHFVKMILKLMHIHLMSDMPSFIPVPDFHF